MNEIVDIYNTTATEYAQSRIGEEDVVWLEKFQNILNAGNVLDLGCAAGRDTRILNDMGFKVVGVDLAEKLLDIARQQNPDIEFLHVDMRNLPFEDGSFDGVWASAVLHHVKKEEMPQVLKELCRVLAPGGVLNISTKAGSGTLQTREDTVLGKIREFELITVNELNALLAECGFREIESKEEPSKSRKNLFWIKGLYGKPC